MDIHNTRNFLPPKTVTLTIAAVCFSVTQLFYNTAAAGCMLHPTDWSSAAINDSSDTLYYCTSDQANKVKKRLIAEQQRQAEEQEKAMNDAMKGD